MALPTDSGDGTSSDAPLIVLSRHAGPADSFLLLHEVMSWEGRRPRIVAKAALQLDPVFDILLNRLPNRFIMQNPTPGSDTTSSIAELASGMTNQGAFVIFPEGGNFRLRKAAAHGPLNGCEATATKRRPDAESMTHVLAPPRRAPWPPSTHAPPLMWSSLLTPASIRSLRFRTCGHRSPRTRRCIWPGGLSRPAFRPTRPSVWTGCSGPGNASTGGSTSNARGNSTSIGRGRRGGHTNPHCRGRWGWCVDDILLAGFAVTTDLRCGWFAALVVSLGFEEATGGGSSIGTGFRWGLRCLDPGSWPSRAGG